MTELATKPDRASLPGLFPTANDEAKRDFEAWKQQHSA